MVPVIALGRSKRQCAYKYSDKSISLHFFSDAIHNNRDAQGDKSIACLRKLGSVWHTKYQPAEGVSHACADPDAGQKSPHDLHT
jgi:hypothetical protein